MRAGDLQVGTEFAPGRRVTSVEDAGTAVCSPKKGAEPVPVVRVSFDGAPPLLLDREVDVKVVER